MANLETLKADRFGIKHTELKVLFFIYYLCNCFCKYVF